jgi:hypothetical protein
MATKNGLVESLVISETATGPPAAAEPAAEEAGAAAEEAGAAAEEATAAAEEAADEAVSLVLELHAAKVTDRAPTTAMAATALPRVKRLVMWFPFEGWVVATGGRPTCLLPRPAVGETSQNLDTEPLRCSTAPIRSCRSFSDVA